MIVKRFVVAFNIAARNIGVAQCDHGEHHFYSSVNNVERVKQELFCPFVIFMFSFTYDGIFEEKKPATWNNLIKYQNVSYFDIRNFFAYIHVNF